MYKIYEKKRCNRHSLSVTFISMIHLNRSKCTYTIVKRIVSLVDGNVYTKKNEMLIKYSDWIQWQDIKISIITSIELVFLHFRFWCSDIFEANDNNMQCFRLFSKVEGAQNLAENLEILTESAFIWLSDTYQTENTEMTDFLRDFYDKKHFYLTFSPKKGKASLETRLPSEFTREFSKISQKVE
jgi:hypothetical protein